MKFAIYSTSTGLIDRVITLQDATHLGYNTGVNEAIIAVTTETDATHYIASGALTAFPARPTPSYLWDTSVNGWRDPRTLGVAIKQAAARVKAGRDLFLLQGLPTTYGIFDSSIPSQTSFQWLINQAQQDSTYTCVWQLADDSNVSLAASDILSIQSQAMTYFLAVHTKAVTLKQAALACTTNSGADAIQWAYP